MGKQARVWSPYLAYCSLAILVAWTLRLYRLDAHSFWYDEGYCVFVAALPPAEILPWTGQEFIPPLYHSLLALWLPLAGWTEFAARFLSVWVGTLTAAGIARLAKDLHSRQAGLVAGLLAALSPYYVWHSQDARMYMSQALFGLLATLLLVRALRRPTQLGLWVGFALLDALALYAHTTTGLLLAFHALVILVAGLWSPDRSVRWRRGGLALAGAVLAWLPWVVYAFPFLEENAGYWPGHLNWHFVVAGAYRGLVTGQMMDGIVEKAALILWGVACLVGAFALPISSASRGWKIVLFLLAYFAVPVVVMAMLFQNVPKFSPRYLIVASAPVFLLPALGIATLFGRSGVLAGARWVGGGLIIAALATAAGMGLRNLYFNPAFAKSDFRTAARLVREQMAPGEVVLVVPGHTFPVWQYYFGSEGWLALPNDPILNVNHVLHYHNTAGRLSEWLIDFPGVWLVEWEPWVVDPTDLVVHLLEQVGEEVPLPEGPVGLRLRHYRLRADSFPLPPEPAVFPPVGSSLDLPLKLVGCALPEQVRGDEGIRIGCYWEAQDALPHYLSVSARLIDAAGAEWGRADTAISGPHLVAGRWPLDEPVFGRYALDPSPGIPPGDFYRLELLVYELDGTEHGAVAAGSLVVDRPYRPFTVTLPASQAVSGRLGGLILEAANVGPEQVLPGEAVTVEALWQVVGPFHEPHLAVEGLADESSLLPRSGATGVWEVRDRYRTISRVPISPYALGGATTLWAISEDGEIPVGTVHVDIDRAFTLPVEVEPMGYRLGDVISLAGVAFSVGRGGAGETAEAVLYWQAVAFVEQSYIVFVHLVGPDGQIYAQADGPPQAGRHPTTHWLPGEVVPDAYRLERPAGAPAGEYRVLAGLYDRATLARLPVSGADGSPVPDDAILIGRFEVLQEE